MVNVNRRSIESSRMNREMVNHPTSASKVSSKSASARKVGRVGERLTKEDHESDEMTAEVVPLEPLAGVPGDGNHQHSVRGHVQSPEAVVHALGVDLSALELKVAIIAREEASEADEHLSERRVDVKVELALDVVRPKLSKVGLVPDDRVGPADPVVPSAHGEERVGERDEMVRIVDGPLPL